MVATIFGNNLRDSTASVSAGAAAMDALRTMDLRYFVAGGTCAAISHGITTPIDVVKTKIQAKPKVRTMYPINFKTTGWLPPYVG